MEKTYRSFHPTIFKLNSVHPTLNRTRKLVNGENEIDVMIKKNDFSTQGKSCNYLSSTAANLDTESSAKKHSSEVNTFNA